MSALRRWVMALIAMACLPPVRAAERGVLEFPVSWSAPDRVVVPMKLRHGVPAILCAVNGREIWMTLDTGSQRCVLEAETAAKAGVRTMARSAASVEVTGTRGKEIGLVGVPKTMAVGAWKWERLPCVVRTLRSKPAPTALFSKAQVAFDILGMDALGAMCSYVTVDYPRREVAFGFRKRFRPADAAATRQPFETRDGTPFVRASHAGREWLALVDTGASSELELNRTTAQRLGRQPTRTVEAIQFGLGDLGHSGRRKFECLVLPEVTCLGRSWPKAEAMLVEGDSKIGSGLLQGSRITVDFPGAQVWVEKVAR
jgi:hypothetical protein